MQANRRRDTAPEVAVRSAVHALGLRFRVDLPIRGARGRAIRPDLVFTRQRVAVFVDGCFWHGCPVHGTMPATNRSYWEPKLAANRERDLRATENLQEAGWLVIRAWEHEPPEQIAGQVAEAIDLRRSELAPTRPAEG
jgi:DNA mismatch endonuclease (patch repair protein)